MARLARVVALDTPHHVTQRGNARRFVLESDADRAVYLRLLHHFSGLNRLSIAGYCVMSNHVHLIAISHRPESLALTLKNAHGRFAAYFNARHISSGHVWQGRYYSCPLDAGHFWAALRYIEMNPVRAGLSASAPGYPWSSAALHCGTAGDDGNMDVALWREVWTPAAWTEYLAASVEDEEVAAIRRSTYSGRPLGEPDFIRRLEHDLKRTLRPQRGGRPPKHQPDRQNPLAFGSL